jgi:hypothetical protein
MLTPLVAEVSILPIQSLHFTVIRRSETVFTAYALVG